MELILRGSGEIWGGSWEGSREGSGRDLDRIIAGIGGGSGQGSEREWKKTTSCLGDQMSKSAALAPCSPEKGL